MFSFAALVIHSVFRSDHTPGRQHINMTSGYVDLAPLYGNDQETQDKVSSTLTSSIQTLCHLFRSGTRTAAVCFTQMYSQKIVSFSFLPQFVSSWSCSAEITTYVPHILTIINSTHLIQYIARRLLEINERGTWKDPSHHRHLSHAQLIKQDEEIFQIARLCNCAWFAAVVFSDYFSAILGLVRKGSSWSLEPFDEIRNEDHSVFERGRGNACSVEFNCLYRWHATTSVEDEQWISGQLGALFPGKNVEDITLRDFYTKEATLFKSEPDLQEWTFDT